MTMPTLIFISPMWLSCSGFRRFKAAQNGQEAQDSFRVKWFCEYFGKDNFCPVEEVNK
jgi:hypothetical protein